MDARAAALQVLCACRKKDAWVDAQLKAQLSRDKLDARDAALAARLCYGVTQNRMLLDWYLDALVSGGIKRLQPVVLDILRLAVYQIVFLDKIPASAAVNEAVRQAKKSANDRASGLVNAVLRSFLRRPIPEPPQELSVKYSHPQPLVELLQSAYPDRVEAILHSHNEIAPITLQCNTLLTTPEELTERLREAGVETTPHPWQSGCLIANGLGNPERLEAFGQGMFYIQDPAAQLAVRCAAPKPGDRVLDCCAAPGGKSVAAAILMQNRGQIFSCDLHENKLKRIRQSAERLRLSILTTAQRDARVFCPEWENSMDVVICDVPCSGLGVIRKKPDIRYKPLEQTELLPPLQLEILENQARYVKPGGTLVYSTCTILPRENESVVDAFLNRHPEFAAQELVHPRSGIKAERLTLLPDRDEADGFFICKFRRIR